MGYLDGIVRRCDEWAAKEKRKNDMAIQELQDKGPNDIAKAEIEKLREQASQLLSDAEEMASSGNIDASKLRVEQAEQLQAKAQDWEAKARAPPAADVCEICGMTK